MTRVDNEWETDAGGVRYGSGKGGEDLRLLNGR